MMEQYTSLLTLGNVRSNFSISNPLMMSIQKWFLGILGFLLIPFIGEADTYRSLSALTVNVTGGIGRRPPNTDKISGLVFHAASYPTPLAGFTALSATNTAVHCYSLQDALNVGISATDATFKGLNYQVSEFFRMNPVGELWVAVYPVGTYTFVELNAVQQLAGGAIRQIGMWSPSRPYSNLAADYASLATVSTTMTGNGYHCSIVFACDCSAQASWGTATDLRAAALGNKLSFIIAQDGGGNGQALTTALTYTVPMLGAFLGSVSKAPVNQSVGNPNLFNISNGTECETVSVGGTSGGIPINTLTYATLGGLLDKGYIVARKYTPRITGSYFERTPVSVLATDTFAWMEVVRTIDKAKRITETTMTPQLNAALPTTSTGTLRADIIGFFTDLLQGALNNMKSAGEVSDIIALIDPNQNVNSTSTLVVTVKLIPTGTAQFITINIGVVSSF